MSTSRAMFTSFIAKHRVLLLILPAPLILFFLCIQAPASLLDRLLRQGTDGQLALCDPRGSIWNGSGYLAARDKQSNRYHPVLPVNWKWKPEALLHQRMTWQTGFADLTNTSGEISITPAGLQFDNLSLAAPARPLLAQLPGMFSGLGWSGMLQLTTTAWQCNWRAICQGELHLLWYEAGTDIFPDHALGNYTLSITGQADHLTLEVSTRSGEIQLTGNGSWKPGSRPRLSGRIQGNAPFLSRLSDRASPWVQKGSSSETLLFTL